VHIIVHNSRTQHSIHSSSDYLPSYPPEKHQSSDADYWRGGCTGVYKCDFQWIPSDILETVQDMQCIVTTVY